MKNPVKQTTDDIGWCGFIVCSLWTFGFAGVAITAIVREMVKTDGMLSALLITGVALVSAIVVVAVLVSKAPDWAVTREDFDSDEEWEDHKAFVDSIT